MFCRNCGNEINENERFCSQCGTGVEQPVEEVTEVTEAAQMDAPVSGDEAPAEIAAPEINAEDNSIAEIEVQDEQPHFEEVQPVQDGGNQFVPDDGQYFDINSGKVKKKSGKFKLPKFVIPIALVLVLTVTAFAHPVTRNTIFKTFMTEEAYFKHVMENNVEDLAKSLTESILGSGSVFGSDYEASGSVTLELGDGAKELIDEYGGSEAYEVISWIDSISATFDAAMTEDVIGGEVAYQINDTDIVSAQISTDDEGIYVLLPELNDEALYIDMSELYGEGMTNVIGYLYGLSESLPDKDLVEEIMVRYITCIFDSIEEVSEETTEIEAGDVQQKCVAVTVEIEPYLIIGAMEAVLTEAQDDKDLEELIVTIAESDLVGMDGDEVYEQFTDVIYEALDNIDELEDSIDFEPFDVTFYVNNRGELTGFETEIEGAEIEVLYAEGSGDYGFVVRIGANNQSVEFEGGGTLKGDKYNGVHTLSVMGIDILDIELVDVDKSLMEDGILNGKYIIEASENIDGLMKMAVADADAADIISKLRIEIESTSKSEKNMNGKVSFYYDDELLVSASAEATNSTDVDFAVPDDYVEVNDSDDMNDWAEACEDGLDNILDKLEDAGLPSKFAREIR